MARRSKIVCTLGPASDAPRVLARHGRRGHGRGPPQFLARERCRAPWPRRGGAPGARRAGRNVAILQDLQGPKLRLGVFAEGRVELIAGESVLLVTRRGVVGSPRLIPVPLPSLARDCSAWRSGAAGRRPGAPPRPPAARRGRRGGGGGRWTHLGPQGREPPRRGGVGPRVHRRRTGATLRWAVRWGSIWLPCPSCGPRRTSSGRAGTSPRARHSSPRWRSRRPSRRWRRSSAPRTG